MRSRGERGKKKDKEEIIGVEEISRGAVAGLEEAFDADNIHLIDYGSKEDEIFRSLESNEENVEDLDISKIYMNELEISEDEMEHIKKFEEDLRKNTRIEQSTGDSRKDTGICTKLGIDLNSDVGNDICKENLEKIYTYLKRDEEAEKVFEQEIGKTFDFIAQTEQPIDKKERREDIQHQKIQQK